MRSRRVLLAAAVVLVLGVAGCGEETPEQTAEDTQPQRQNAATIEMRDYSFAVSGTPRAGRGTLRLSNTGEEIHMTEFIALKDGKTLDDASKALGTEDEADDGQVFDEREVHAGATLAPGASEEITAELPAAGKYALVCFIPTAGEGRPHYAKGMIAEMDVAEADGEATAPEADVELSISKGKLSGPTTLRSGSTTFAVEANDEVHEFLALKLSRPGTTYEQVDAAFTRLFEARGGPAKGYASRLPAQLVGGAHEIPSGETIYVRFDLEPGEYLIGCALRPEGEGDQGPPPHRNEMLRVTVT